MLIYRIFPHLPTASPGEPGHPLYVHPDQGTGRWDNPDLYLLLYASSTPSGAIGESFAHLSTWSQAMLPFPTIDLATRRLGIYSINEEGQPLLDLDDPNALAARSLRPTDVVKRNRPHTQEIARRIFHERRWTGISWWSMHRPQWTLHALWGREDIRVEGIEDLEGHPGVRDAGTLLAKALDPNLLP